MRYYLGRLLTPRVTRPRPALRSSRPADDPGRAECILLIAFFSALCYRTCETPRMMDGRSGASRMRALSRKRYLVLIAALLGSLGLPVRSEAGLDLWTPKGPPGAKIYSIAVARTNPSVVYVGLLSYSGYGFPGIWKSVDGGRDWFRQTSGFSGFTNFAAVAISPVDENTAYAVSGEHVLETTDGGVTWNTLSTFPFFAGPLAIVIDPSSPGSIYVCGLSGVARSRDAGETWTLGTGLGGGYVSSLAIDPRNPSRLFAGSQSGVFGSTDAGATWAPSGTGIPAGALVEGVVIDPRDPAVIFAGTEAGLYKSTDGGENWGFSGAGMGSAFVRVVAVDPVASNHLYVGTDENGLFESFDGGASWSEVPAVCSSNVLAIALDPAIRPPNRRKSFVGGTGGLWSTVDGGASWTRETGGLSYTDATAVLVDPNDSSRVLAGIYGEGIAESDDRGETLALTCGSIPNTNVLSLVADPRSPSVMWAGTDAGIYRSVDSGKHWTARGLEDAGVYLIAVDPADSAVVYAGILSGGTHRLTKSVDGGASWEFADTGLRDYGIPNAIAINPLETGVVYVAMGYGSEGGLYKSQDAGSSWKLTSFGPRAVTAMALDQMDPNKVYAASTDGLSVSTDGALTWQRLPPLGNIAIIVIDPTDDQRMYLGAPGYISRTTDGWKTSSQYSLHGSDVYAFAIDPKMHDRVYAGVADQGVLSLDLANPYPPPGSLAASGTAISVAEGVPFTTVIANFVDGDANRPGSNYQLAIDWGDGSSSDGAIGGYVTAPTVTGTHTYAEDGTFTVTITIHDIADNKDAVAMTTAIVTNTDNLLGRPRIVYAAPGTPFSGPVAELTDANAAKTSAGLAATIDWGDGTITPGAVVGGSGAFTVNDTHTYLAPAVFGITVTVQETEPGAVPQTIRGHAIVSRASRQSPRSGR
jgi:photosystem II stability/assembly factor-like uncharacterized protein